MAVSMIYLDDHGKQVAERVSDITYKSEDIFCRFYHDKYWFMNSSEENLVFECGSDKRGFIKYPEWEQLITFYVRMRGYKRSRWYSPDYPERNTIYISPEEDGLTQTEYYSLCYQQAEEKIRALAKLVSASKNNYIEIKFSDFRCCFSQAFFVDAFTIEKPHFSQINDAVYDAAARCKEELNGLKKTNVLIYVSVPENFTVDGYCGLMDVIGNCFTDSKVFVGLGFIENTASVSVTVGISYCCPNREENKENYSRPVS